MKPPRNWASHIDPHAAAGRSIAALYRAGVDDRRYRPGLQASSADRRAIAAADRAVVGEFDAAAGQADTQPAIQASRCPAGYGTGVRDDAGAARRSLDERGSTCAGLGGSLKMPCSVRRFEPVLGTAVSPVIVKPLVSIVTFLFSDDKFDPIVMFWVRMIVEFASALAAENAEDSWPKVLT